MAEHRHEFHRLWWHLGPYGRQDVHLHPCGGSCKVELVGIGRDCDGDQSTHVRKTLTERSAWSKREHEGAALLGSSRADR